MTNRQKIEKKLKGLGITAKSISYKPCMSSPIYGDWGMSGEWTVILENGEEYISSPDYDTVAEAVDQMLEYMEDDFIESTTLTKR